MTTLGNCRDPRGASVAGSSHADEGPGSNLEAAFLRDGPSAEAPRAKASALITAPRQDFEALQLPLSSGLFQLPDIDLPLLETEPVKSAPTLTAPNWMLLPLTVPVQL